MNTGRNHTQEAIEKIRLELVRLPGQSREKIMSRTGTGIPEFQAAQKALGLVSRITEGGNSYGRLMWSLPIKAKPIDLVCVMQAAPYIERSHGAPRPGSLHYKSIQSRGMPT